MAYICKKKQPFLRGRKMPKAQVGPPLGPRKKYPWDTMPTGSYFVIQTTVQHPWAWIKRMNKRHKPKVFGAARMPWDRHNRYGVWRLK